MATDRLIAAFEGLPNPEAAASGTHWHVWGRDDRGDGYRSWVCVACGYVFEVREAVFTASGSFSLGEDGRRGLD